MVELPIGCTCLTKCWLVGLSVGPPSQVNKNKERGAFLERYSLDKNSGKSTLRTDCISKDFLIMIISPSMSRNRDLCFRINGFCVLATWNFKLFISLPLQLAHERGKTQTSLKREFMYEVWDIRALNFLLQLSKSLESWLNYRKWNVQLNCGLTSLFTQGGS